MKRVIISVIILAVIIIYSVFGIYIMNKRNSRLVSLLDEIQVCYEKDDLNSALYAAQSLDKEWHVYEKRMSMFIRDDKIQNLNMSVARITPYLNDSNDELNAEIENIYHQLKLMYHAEFPTWYNIL